MNRSEILAKNLERMEYILANPSYVPHTESTHIYNIVASYSIAELGRERVKLALAFAAKLNS